MKDDLGIGWLRWQAAERAGNDDAADAAFAGLYRAVVPPPPPSPHLVSDTMKAVSAVSVAGARRARRLRVALLWAGLPVTLVLVWLSAGTAVAMLSGAVVWSLNLLVSTAVLVADSSDARRAGWSIVSGLGRATAAFVTDPRVTFGLLVCQVLAAAALAALHRLLGSGREGLR